MISTYFDSSALVRLVLRQGDTSIVERALSTELPTSSVLARLEVLGAIHRRRLLDEITPAECDSLVRFADSEVLSLISFLALGGDVLTQAEAVVEQYLLHALDALHLASASVAQRRARRHGTAFHFCTADRRQAEAAREMFGEHKVIFVPPLSSEQT